MTEHSDIDIGSPATYGIGSDSYPATVIGVTRKEGEITSVTIQQDHTVLPGLALVACERNGLPRPPGANLSIPDSEGTKYTFTRRKNGALVTKGHPMKSPCGYVSLGKRHFSQDPDF